MMSAYRQSKIPRRLERLSAHLSPTISEGKIHINTTKTETSIMSGRVNAQAQGAGSQVRAGARQARDGARQAREGARHAREGARQARRAAREALKAGRQARDAARQAYQATRGIQDSSPEDNEMQLDDEEMFDQDKLVLDSIAALPSATACDIVLEETTDPGMYVLSYHEVKVSAGVPVIRSIKPSTGFPHCHLRLQGALDLPLSFEHLAPNLGGPSLDLFATCRWTQGTDYELVAFNQPMHRLVTKFLTHPSCTLYFQNALFAPRLASTTLGPDGAIREIPRIRKIYEWSLERHQSWLKVLSAILEKTTIRFEDHIPGAYAAITQRGGRYIIRLREDFANVARNLMSYANLDVAKAMR